MSGTDSNAPRFISDRSGRIFVVCFLLVFIVFFGVLLIGTITAKLLHKSLAFVIS